MDEDRMISIGEAAAALRGSCGDMLAEKLIAAADSRGSAGDAVLKTELIGDMRDSVVRCDRLLRGYYGDDMGAGFQEFCLDDAVKYARKNLEEPDLPEFERLLEADVAPDPDTLRSPLAQFKSQDLMAGRLNAILNVRSMMKDAMDSVPADMSVAARSVDDWTDWREECSVPSPSAMPHLEARLELMDDCSAEIAARMGKMDRMHNALNFAAMKLPEAKKLELLMTISTGTDPMPEFAHYYREDSKDYMARLGDDVRAYVQGRDSRDLPTADVADAVRRSTAPYVDYSAKPEDYARPGAFRLPDGRAILRNPREPVKFVGHADPVHANAARDWILKSDRLLAQHNVGGSYDTGAGLCALEEICADARARLPEGDRKAFDGIVDNTDHKFRMSSVEEDAPGLRRFAFQQQLMDRISGMSGALADRDGLEVSGFEFVGSSDVDPSRSLKEYVTGRDCDTAMYRIEGRADMLEAAVESGRKDYLRADRLHEALCFAVDRVPDSDRAGILRRLESERGLAFAHGAAVPGDRLAELSGANGMSRRIMEIHSAVNPDFDKAWAAARDVLGIPGAGGVPGTDGPDV